MFQRFSKLIQNRVIRRKRRWIRLLPKSFRSGPFWLENFLALVLAIAVLLALRSSVLEYFKIPSGSMIPSLLVGDHIFVSKFAYGWTFPFGEGLTGYPWRLGNQKLPQAGDVIVFKNPNDPTQLYVKRVVGLPGDRVEIREKVLYLNGRPVPRKALSPEESRRLFKELENSHYSPDYHEAFWEFLGARKYGVLLERAGLAGEQFGPVVVPDQQLFVLGDNRDYSNDSRFMKQIYVPLDLVRGQAFLIWFSRGANAIGGKSTLRLDRIGKMIDGSF